MNDMHYTAAAAGASRALTAERKREIQQKAEAILEEYHLLPGFDLTRFLTDKKGFVLSVQELEPDTTGEFLIDSEKPFGKTNANKLILINQKLQEKPDFQQRRRFIAAHEFAHAVLHANNKRFYWHRDTSNVSALMEQEAEFFARCLLMPEESVRDMMKISAMQRAEPKDRAALISRVFNVTQKKALQRMEDLALT
ncbi:MAG: ImmA/IrrE family metallo-endopeptidase [Oscillospiraceae bacterium]|nr:ImmA/IrrE family metallo-endopeptidase [Oscillospiraceae bacterium]